MKKSFMLMVFMVYMSNLLIGSQNLNDEIQYVEKEHGVNVKALEEGYKEYELKQQETGYIEITNEFGEVLSYKEIGQFMIK